MFVKLSCYRPMPFFIPPSVFVCRQATRQFNVVSRTTTKTIMSPVHIKPLIFMCHLRWCNNVLAAPINSVVFFLPIYIKLILLIRVISELILSSYLEIEVIFFLSVWYLYARACLDAHLLQAALWWGLLHLVLEASLYDEINNKVCLYLLETSLYGESVLMPIPLLISCLDRHGSGNIRGVAMTKDEPR